MLHPAEDSKPIESPILGIQIQKPAILILLHSQIQKIAKPETQSIESAIHPNARLTELAALYVDTIQIKSRKKGLLEIFPIPLHASESGDQPICHCLWAFCKRVDEFCTAWWIDTL